MATAHERYVFPDLDCILALVDSTFGTSSSSISSNYPNAIARCEQRSSPPPSRYASVSHTGMSLVTVCHIRSR